jgi:hypothetical protein
MCSRHDMNEIMLNFALRKIQSFLCIQLVLVFCNCHVQPLTNLQIVEGIQYYVEAEQALTKIVRLLKAVSIWLMRY